MGVGWTADQVLRAFTRSELYLFLGAAFGTVGLLAVAVSLLRRKLDAPLLLLGLFAALYGWRLWLTTGMVRILLFDAAIFPRLQAATNYAVPIPGFLFFYAVGFMGRLGRWVAYTLTGYFSLLVAGTFLFGPLAIFRYANNSMVIVALIFLLVRSFTGKAVDRDQVIIRKGLLAFVVLALADNVAGAFSKYPQLEQFGFAVFLACLGYVAARRLLRRDEELVAIRKELEVARRIQMSILPGDFPESAHFRVAARYVPMTSVAGDFYDFLVTDARQAGLLVADVSGHGVPAALIASMVKLAATSQREHAAEPAMLLKGMNAALCGNTQQQFVTAAYAHLDAEAGELRYAAAGHPPLLLVRDGAVSEIVENGLMLAAFPWAEYGQVAHRLQAGDRLVLYTDGVVEAADAREEEFGQQRLRSLLLGSAGQLPAEAADGILSAVEAWSPAQADDLTVLVCDFVGRGRPVDGVE